MKQYLENIATDQGWAFKYARPDYLAGDNGHDTPNNMEAGTIALFCDPIETRPDLNNEGTRQGFRYIGRFMLLEKSEIDETYADKYDNYIEQMIAYLEVLERELACQGIELVVWRWEEIINEHWSNMDGVLVNFEARVWDTTPPEAVTSLSLTNANQEITLTDPITAAVGTANKPSRFFLMGNTEGLILTVNSETQATITGTPTSNTNAVLVARGKFGGFQVARLNITFPSAENEIDITINGDAYDTVTENTDIPVVNSEDTPVGTIDGLNVEIGDSSAFLKVNNGTSYKILDIPAEGSGTKNIPCLNNANQTVGGFMGSQIIVDDSNCNIQINGAPLRNNIIAAEAGITDNVIIENTAELPVGFVNSGIVTVSDADISITLNSVEVATETVPAEGSVVIPIDAYVTKVPITLTYETLAKTIWESNTNGDAQLKGGFGTIDAVPSVTDPAPIINYSASTPVAGVAVNASTGQVSQSSYASIPSGANSLVIAWEVDGSDPYYEGSGTVEIIITKRTRWRPTNLTNIRNDLSYSFFIDEGDVTEIATGEVSQVLAYDNSTTITQGTSDRRATITKIRNGREVLGFRGSNNSLGNTNAGRAALNATFHFFCAGRWGASIAASIFSNEASINVIEFAVSHTGVVISIIVNSVTLTFTGTIDRTVAKKLFGREIVIRFSHISGAHVLAIYNSDELVTTLSSTTVSTGNFATTNFSVSSRSSSNQAGSRQGLACEQFIVEQSLTGTEISNSIDHLRYQLGHLTTPPFV